MFLSRFLIYVFSSRLLLLLLPLPVAHYFPLSPTSPMLLSWNSSLVLLCLLFRSFSLRLFLVFCSSPIFLYTLLLSSSPSSSTSFCFFPTLLSCIPHLLPLLSPLYLFSSWSSFLLLSPYYDLLPLPQLPLSVVSLFIPILVSFFFLLYLPSPSLSFPSFFSFVVVSLFIHVT